MEKLTKEQFSYEHLVPAGKDIHKSEPFAAIHDSYKVSFKENGKTHTAEFTDLYFLNVFQYPQPKQEDMQRAKQLILKHQNNI